MKKLLLSSTLFLLSTFTTTLLMAQRYTTEVFTSTTVTHNVLYGWNISIIPTDDDATGHTIPLPGNPSVYNDSLRADIYEPVGDTLAARPTVIMIHTGSFLPVFYNGQTTGQKLDSSITEMCRQFARRGYTAIAVDYRAGWNPLASGAAGQEIRTGSLLQAAGRGIQDVKACVRFFRNNVLNGGNTWHIDESKIILGGMGTGGYIALGYATIDNYAKICLPKFTATVTNGAYGFIADSSYFAMSLWGDVDGYGGLPFLNNSSNTPGIANDVSFVFNMGGAMGDSSWLEAGDVPMVCIHPIHDPFAPFNIGPVIVPTTGDFVVEAFGSYYVIERADTLGNNYRFQNNTWTDPYTLRANMLNNGHDGLFPLDLAPSPFPPNLNQAAPWEWWDSTTVYSICMGLLGFTMGHTDTIYYGSLATNWDMSRTKAIAYIDTVMNYLNPRIVGVILPTGIAPTPSNENQVRLYPNPSTGNVFCDMNGERIESIYLYDVSGRLVYQRDNIKSTQFTLSPKGLRAGMYYVKILSDKGEVIRKLSLQ